MLGNAIYQVVGSFLQILESTLPGYTRDWERDLVRET